MKNLEKILKPSRKIEKSCFFNTTLFNTLLGHPKLLGFITHGGLNSITESAVNGVPIICIPLFADQMRNCKMMKYRKTANVVTKANLNEENLIKAMQAINSKR